jgi:hypothetical protein
LTTSVSRSADSNITGILTNTVKLLHSLVNWLMNFFHLGLTTVLSTQTLRMDSLWMFGELNSATFKMRIKMCLDFSLLLLSYKDLSASRRAPSCPQKLTNFARTISTRCYLEENVDMSHPQNISMYRAVGRNNSIMWIFDRD